jgi:hypothetical protein
MNFDLFGSRPKTDPKRISEVKEWAIEVFRLPADVSVMLTELRCTEPGCPPLETVIAILDQPGKPRQYKIHKAIADLTFADVLLTAQGNCSHGNKE